VHDFGMQAVWLGTGIYEAADYSARARALGHLALAWPVDLVRLGGMGVGVVG
jgi:hypothetical protein